MYVVGDRSRDTFLPQVIQVPHALFNTPVSNKCHCLLRTLISLLPACVYCTCVYLFVSVCVYM